MATIQRVNFELISDVIPVVRRDFKLATPALVDPLNANVLIDGEWMVLNNDCKLQRATDITAGKEGIKALYLTNRVRSFPLFAERGRTDVQALLKTVILFGGWFEAETRIFDGDAKGTDGANQQYAAISYVGQPLQVATVTIGTRNLSGLVAADITEYTTNVPFIVGWVTRLPANNGGKLRFRCEPCR